MNRQLCRDYLAGCGKSILITDCSMIAMVPHVFMHLAINQAARRALPRDLSYQFNEIWSINTACGIVKLLFWLGSDLPPMEKRYFGQHSVHTPLGLYVQRPDRAAVGGHLQNSKSAGCVPVPLPPG